MKCPRCGNKEDKVIETRHIAEDTIIRRRRECISCSYRFTSYEQVEEKPLMVIKRDGSRETFNINKIMNGLNIALKKRPVPQSKIENLLQEIEEEAFFMVANNNEISSNEIGELVMVKLSSIDKVAYIRFASVYRDYETVDEFTNEIKRLSKKAEYKKHN